MKTIDLIKYDIETSSSCAIAVEGTHFVVPREKLCEIALFLKGNPDYQMDYLSSLTGVDYKDYFEVVYHLYSMAKKHGPITLKVRAGRDDAKIPSVMPIWRSAEYQEREAYDLLGIHFENHPDLRRILMWEGFEHHPLRKDYAPENQDRDISEFNVPS